MSPRRRGCSRSAGRSSNGRRLLDNRAQPLSVPITVGERIDETTGLRWITADLRLAPLGPGDYVVELVLVGPADDPTVLTAIRVTR